MKSGFTIDRAPFDGVVAFLRVAERQSFRLAAADLGISPSALSQAIRRLEERVGVALLARTTRKVGLTEAGERFLRRALPATGELAAAFESARELGSDVAGLLRLNVPRALLRFIGDNLIEDFCAANPRVQVEIFAEDRLVDIVAEGFDAGIRLGELVDKDMIAARLAPPFAYAVVGAPRYFETHGEPKRPEDLTRHLCIRSRRSSRVSVYRWEFEDGARAFDLAVSGPLIVNDPMMNLSAAVAGIGLAYMPEPTAREYVVRGQLKSVLGKFMPRSPGLFLYYPSRHQALPKLKAFVVFAKRKIRQIDRDARASVKTGRPR
jgi:DNA-binding transcriptional LysR family regulator